MKTTVEQRAELRRLADNHKVLKWPELVDLLDDFDTLEAENAALKEQVKPKCPECNSVGLSHCSDPEHCGGVYWPDHMYRALEAENEKLKAALEAIIRRVALVSPYYEMAREALTPITSRASTAEEENEKLKEMLRDMQKDKDFMQHSLREAQNTIEELKTPYTLNKEESK